MMLRRAPALIFVVGVFAIDARADNVAQVETAKQITRDTVILLNPCLPNGDGVIPPNCTPGQTATTGNVNVNPGDILTFRIRFTPVPNGATRGLGGYVTDYIPANTEVVGARIVDANDNTVPPHLGGLAQDGVGPRGSRNYPAPLENGSISQLYADTGIFFSTDLRNARTPDDQFLTVNNGLAMSTTTTIASYCSSDNAAPCNSIALGSPTGANMLTTLLGATSPTHAHSTWDAVEGTAWGAGRETFGGTANVAFSNSGTGNAPFGYGSPVAGPDSHSPFEITPTDVNHLQATSTVGPWKRVLTPGAQIGQGSAVSGAGPVLRTGVAADTIGVDVSTDSPLPSIAHPDDDNEFTTAVRFALGELVVGDEYFAEISLRVLATPLDPVQNENVNCAEVFGGDASAFNNTTGGKDNAWRYFVASPSCVQLDLDFELAVDKLIAVSGDTLTYTIDGRNLSTAEATNANVSFALGAGETFVSASNGGTNTSGVVHWPTMNLDPNASYEFIVTVKAGNNGASTLAKATYVSDQIPSPGFTVVALTDVRALVVMDQQLGASPGAVNAGDSVRYAATITNSGTGALNFTTCSADPTPSGKCAIAIALPAGFTVRAGSATANGNATTNPTVQSGTAFFFGPFANVAAGGQLVLAFDVDVGTAVAPGLYTSSIDVFADDTGFGHQIEGATNDTAPVLVGIVRSAPPVITAPVNPGDTVVSGTTTEADGTAIDLFVNDVARGTGTSALGRWSVTGVPALFEGQELTATATATGKFASFPSDPVFVGVTPGSGGEGEGEGAAGEGEGATGEGEGEGAAGEGEGEGASTGEGEGEGASSGEGEGEGEGASTGEGEGAAGEGEGVGGEGEGVGGEGEGAGGEGEGAGGGEGEGAAAPPGCGCSGGADPTPFALAALIWLVPRRRRASRSAERDELR